MYLNEYDISLLLERILKEEMKKKKLKNKFLALKLHPKLDFKKIASTASHISRVTNGYIYGPNNKNQKNLYRLSMIIYAIGIEQNETTSLVIESIKQTNNLFEYPPKDGISYEELVNPEFITSNIIESCKVLPYALEDRL